MFVRIAQVAPFFPPHVGGVESHVAWVSQELARRGHEVTVVTTRLPGTPRRERWEGCFVERVSPVSTLWSTPVAPATAGVVAQGRFDLVHSHSPPPLTSFYAGRGARRAGSAHVLTYHCDLELPFFGGAGLVRVYERTLGAATVRGADALVATTRTYAGTSRALWRRGDVHVVPNAVDASRFSPDLDGSGPRRRLGLGGGPIALFVGRLTHHKGVEEFVRAAAFTPADVMHVVVGEGPRRARLERLARDSGLERKVVFAGQVRHEDLPSYYAAATVGVLPSTSRLEAFGIAALEAMACERPVVVSRIPGVREVVEDEDTGLLAEPLNARDLAEKITRVVTQPELARRLGERARARIVEHFTIERVVDALEGVYKAALNRASASARGE